jgi:hypothetical protein
MSAGVFLCVFCRFFTRPPRLARKLSMFVHSSPIVARDSYTVVHIRRRRMRWDFPAARVFSGFLLYICVFGARFGLYFVYFMVFLYVFCAFLHGRRDLRGNWRFALVTIAGGLRVS